MPEPDQQLDRDSLDAEYRQEYLRWVSSLPPSDRATLRDLGLDRPHAERTSFAYIKPEVFRRSTSEVGIALPDYHGDGWHPGLPLPDSDHEEGDELDEGELKNLARFDPEIIGSIMRILFTPQLGHSVNPKACLTKLFALAHALGIEGIRDFSLEHWAQKIGCTRAILSYHATKVRDFAKLDCRAGKCQLARDRFAASQLWNSNRRTGTARKQRGEARV